MPDQQEVIRYHTAGRRQPMLIGKDASGRRIPGGPYTVYQIFAVVVVAGSLWKTRTIWAGEMTQISSVLVVLAAAAGAGFLTGRLDFAGRNPVWILVALAATVPSLTTNRPGRLAGKPLPGAKQRQVRCLAVAAQTRDNPGRHHAAGDPAVADDAAAGLTTNPLAEDGPATGPTGEWRPQPIGLHETVSVQPQPPAGSTAPRLTSLEAFLAAAGKVTS